MNCSIIDCNRKSSTKGLCPKHYQRYRKYGDPLFVKIKIERHGYRYHPLYGVWRGMKLRCYVKSNSRYEGYMERGIIMCDEWRNSFTVFLKWALPLWSPELQIDRENNDGNYCPENCRFVTPKENNDNRRLLQKNNTSGYRGVCYIKDKNKWESRCYINGKRKFLGFFSSPEKAAIAYDNFIKQNNDNRPTNGV